jgi:hypothetical protein
MKSNPEIQFAQIGGCIFWFWESLGVEFSDTSGGATTALHKRGHVKNLENPSVKATPGAPTSLRSANL